jgi:hypothetical protein
MVSGMLLSHCLLVRMVGPLNVGLLIAFKPQQGWGGAAGTR